MFQIYIHYLVVFFFYRQKLMRGIGVADFGYGDLVAPSKLIINILTGD